MRRFALTLFLSVVAAFAADRIRTVTILHTNDLHAHAAANQDARGESGTTGIAFSGDGPLLQDLIVDWIKKKREVGD